MSKHTMWRATLLLLALAVLPACASAPIADADAAALAAADRGVGDGCYDCLLEARDTYARLAVGRARPLIVQRLFETELLIALRERELALDDRAAEARAAALVPELPAGLDGARVLATLGHALPDPAGVARERLSALRTARRDRNPADDLAWLRTVPMTEAARRYVEMSVDCAYPIILDAARRPLRPDSQRPEVSADAPALLRYRAALCFSPDLSALEAVYDASARWLEAAFVLARVRVANAGQNGAPGVRDLLDPVAERFAASPAVTYVYGNYLQLLGECRDAIGRYDDTLRLEPGHEDAMLGRVVCFSHLRAHADAIAGANTLLEWGRYHIPDAHYWLAWNYHVMKDLPTARLHIESAKRIAATGQIFTLAGVIEHDQDDLPPAESDLNAALGMSYGSRNCTALWYLGLVHIKQERWLDSAGAFERGMDCYRQNVLDSEASKRTMELRTDLDPIFKANQLAGFDAAIREDRSQYHAAAFNAANQFTRGGNVARARELVEVAAKDPALDNLVSQLREILRKIGG